MTKELDLLLKSIEEPGGFRDACTRSLQSSIEEVEQSMDTLSKQCKIRMVMFLCCLTLSFHWLVKTSDYLFHFLLRLFVIVVVMIPIYIHIKCIQEEVHGLFSQRFCHCFFFPSSFALLCSFSFNVHNLQSSWCGHVLGLCIFPKFNSK